MIVTVDDVPFAVRIDGSDASPVLLLSNSLSSDMSMWDDQVGTWARRFRIVRYDSRGHGATPATPGPYTIEQLGRDALAVLDALGVGRAHFCGLSMGGMVGMWILTHAPERIGRAVLANTSAHMGPRSLWDGRIELARAGGMRAMIRRTSLEGYVGSCEAIREMDQRESIRAIRNPVLVVIGANDPATTPEAGRQIHEAIPESRLAILDAAHISCVEQPEAFTRTVDDFLAAT